MKMLAFGSKCKQKLLRENRFSKTFANLKTTVVYSSTKMGKTIKTRDQGLQLEKKDSDKRCFCEVCVIFWKIFFTENL